MGVAITHKAPTLGRFVNDSLEDPEVLGRAAERQDGLGGNAGAVVFLSDPEQIRVSDVLARFEWVCTLRWIFSAGGFVRVHLSLQNGAALEAS